MRASLLKLCQLTSTRCLGVIPSLGPSSVLAMTRDKRKSGPNGESMQSRKITKRAKLAKDGSLTEVLLHDVRDLLKRHSMRSENGTEPLDTPVYVSPEKFTEIEVKISDISSTGDGIGISADGNHVYIVPFTVPGDVVQAKVVNCFLEDRYTLADFVKVIEPSPRRDDSRVKCPYFSKCSGCQFQMLSYEDQLAFKKTIIERAYKNFSGLVPDSVPTVGETLGSPLQYGYRTKLTPHFDGPPGRSSLRKGRQGPGIGFVEVPPIGFMMKGMRRTIDIEDCPIGTAAVREGMKRERERVAKEITKFKRGATILLRESTTRKLKSSPTVSDPQAHSLQPTEGTIDDNAHGIDETFNANAASAVLNFSVSVLSTAQPLAEEFNDEKICISDSNAISTEYIGEYVFKNTAGEFFQNNNSILPRFTAYVRDNILSSVDGSTDSVRYLIDAYCGSGLFTVTLSSLFSASMGIDISPASIASARQNATANNIPNASFVAADASDLFAKVSYPPDETVVVIDPPRKGCDDNFLQQLLKFGPRRVVYVSCNVHTQARDTGVLVRGQGTCRYKLESLRGFDFFPQTGHVEGVAILSRVFTPMSPGSLVQGDTKLTPEACVAAHS